MLRCFIIGIRLQIKKIITNENDEQINSVLEKLNLRLSALLGSFRLRILIDQSQQDNLFTKQWRDNKSGVIDSRIAAR